jgi:hypothetical protein
MANGQSIERAGADDFTGFHHLPQRRRPIPKRIAQGSAQRVRRHVAPGGGDLLWRPDTGIAANVTQTIALVIKARLFPTANIAAAGQRMDGGMAQCVKAQFGNTLS